MLTKAEILADRTLRFAEMLTIEISPDCNMQAEHDGKCPGTLACRYELSRGTRPLTDDKIVAIVKEAYRDLGFRGSINWAYYNEPMLSWDRLKALMRRIRECVPEARFTLWTNGTITPATVAELSAFSRIFVTDYGDKSKAFAKAIADTVPGLPVALINGTLDDRIDHDPTPSLACCQKMFREFIVDCYGNVHICCTDYKGEVRIGNVWDLPLDGLVESFGMVRQTVADGMTNKAAVGVWASPSLCLCCKHRTDLGNILEPAVYRDVNPAFHPTILLAMPHGRDPNIQATQRLWQSECQHAAVVPLAKSGSILAFNFNMLWAEALSLAEQGAITHFAMLHDDVVPQQENWLDMLYGELERLGGDMVSAVVAIKDLHGVTSTAIDDPGNPWVVAKRLTVREVAELPETFSAADCGWPERALLVNTGCWMADLRRPVFQHDPMADGMEYPFFFTCKDRILHGADGTWNIQSESEDWFFSRRLHEAGGRAFATRKVTTAHKGGFGFTSDGDWGLWGEDQEGGIANLRRIAAEYQAKQQE